MRAGSKFRTRCLCGEAQNLPLCKIYSPCCVMICKRVGWTDTNSGFVIPSQYINKPQKITGVGVGFGRYAGKYIVFDPNTTRK